MLVQCMLLCLSASSHQPRPSQEATGAMHVQRADDLNKKSSRTGCLGVGGWRVVAWWATLQNPRAFCCHGEPQPPPAVERLLVRRKQREKTNHCLASPRLAPAAAPAIRNPSSAPSPLHSTPLSLSLPLLTRRRLQMPALHPHRRSFPIPLLLLLSLFASSPLFFSPSPAATAVGGQLLSSSIALLMMSKSHYLTIL